ncbi:MAG: hypothetical protein ACLTML_23555 [Blautia faecis]|nr:hypothetical protein [Blautia faecis]
MQIAGMIFQTGSST